MLATLFFLFSNASYFIAKLYYCSTYFLSLRCWRFFLNAFLTRNKTKAARSNFKPENKAERRKMLFKLIPEQILRAKQSIYHLSKEDPEGFASLFTAAGY